MPELPEVETVMRGLRARLEGRVLRRVELRRPDLRWPMPDGLADRLTGRRILSFRRRAKYILMRLDGGETLLLHLGMSGRLVLDATTPLHEHLVLTTDDGARLAFVDPRRFGSLHLMPTEAESAHPLLASLGPEPLDPAFTGPALASRLAGRNTPLKAALLDQRTVAGLGNIYVSEALFRARLSPRRRAGSVTGARAARLVAAIQETLTDAVAAGGSSLRDYVQPNGELGMFQHAWRVYGRTGQPCERCPGDASTPPCPGIQSLLQAGRTTFYCPRTQR